MPNPEYIRIRIIALGENAAVDIPLFHDVKRFYMVNEKDIDKMEITDFAEEANIILILADMRDKFVADHLLEVMKIVSGQQKYVMTIVANYDVAPGTVEAVKLYSSLLIAERQESLEQISSASEKFGVILGALREMIDEKIEEIRILDSAISSLISLESFFDERGEVFVWPELSAEALRSRVQNDQKFASLLGIGSQLWCKFSFDENDMVSREKRNDLIDLLEETIDEDTSCYLTSKELEYGEIAGEKVALMLLVPYDSHYSKMQRRDTINDPVSNIYNLYPLIELLSGQKIYLQEITLSHTYAGLLCGTPSASTNDEIMSSIKDAQKEGIYVINPEIVMISEDTFFEKETSSGNEQKSVPLMPPVKAIAIFEHYDGEDTSWLKIVWFQNDFSTVISDSVRERIVGIDWDQYACEFLI